MVTAEPVSRSPGVRRISLAAGGVSLSALLAEPPDGSCRATVVALHGAGMSAGYFHGQALPEVSLLTLGTCLGFTVLAVDRPGYGESATRLPAGQALPEQTATVRAALDDFTARHPAGAGLFVLAHSFGGKLALTLASQHAGAELLGLDISGCGHRYADTGTRIPNAHDRVARKRNWGPLGLYPPGTFQSSSHLVSPVPEREQAEIERWPGIFPELAARIRAPVRFTFAQHESWWRHETTDLDDLRACLPRASRILIDRQLGAGHNISLGWAARSYHLRALGFLEECLPPEHRAMTADHHR